MFYNSDKQMFAERGEGGGKKPCKRKDLFNCKVIKGLSVLKKVKMGILMQ